MERDLRAIEASAGFQKAYKRLDRLLRERVELTIQKLATDPTLPGLHVERVRGASENVRSCRVTKGMRVIYETTSTGTVRLLCIGNHDVAYRKGVFYWMLSRLVEEEIPTENFGRFAMFQRYRAHIGEEINKDLSEVFSEAHVSENIAGTVIELIKKAIDSGTEGKARPPHDQEPWPEEAMMNVIPSAMKGPCREVLVAFCFDSDSFNGRLREVAYHAGIHCPDTKVVVLVTSQWNAKAWKKNHEKAFGDFGGTVVIYFVDIGGKLTRIA